jgi:hypothetical protein
MRWQLMLQMRISFVHRENWSRGLHKHSDCKNLLLWQGTTGNRGLFCD